MKQMTFADAEYAGKRKQTRKELFLIEMDQVVPWTGLVALIEPHYPKGEGGRPAYPLMAMLRVHLMQNWFGYSDPAMEEALYETTILRQFAGLSLERIPDETTILNFRRLLEKHELAAGILAVINAYLGDRGLSLRQGTIVDATLIHAPSSTKNQDGKRDPEMHQTKKGNQYYFGMKAHIGADAESGLVHSVVGTAANVADVTQVDKLLHEMRTEHQHLVIFENPRMGRVMALDGVIQTSEADEFIYHEMLAHVPILAHGLARRVLIIGGGDGGILREVARHRDIESITMVEIDGAVVEMCREFLPNHSAGTFEDPRLNLVIDDGMHFVATTEEKFDVIISDSTDPIGPGEVLFSENFYQACRRCLNEGGILVAQNGTPFMQLGELQTTAKRMQGLFADWHFYQAAVPTYIGGAMSFAWGACSAESRKLPLEALMQRFAGSGIVTRYYNPHVHIGAFALPQYVLHAIAKPSND